jgi:hypothetical protein
VSLWKIGLLGSLPLVHMGGLGWAGWSSILGAFTGYKYMNGVWGLGWSVDQPLFSSGRLNSMDQSLYSKY